MSFQLLQIQKNEVFEIIKDKSLNPSGFTWIKEDSQYVKGVVSKLVHISSEFYFKFEMSPDLKHRCLFSPAPGKRMAKQYPGSWGNQINYVHSWAEILKAEIDAPDLWSLAQDSKNLIKESYEENGDEKFTAKEVKQIKDKLDELNDYIVKTSNLHTEQYAYIGSRLDYLKGASERLTRKDWKMIFIGLLFNIILQFDFDSPTAHSILMFANNLFTDFYQKLLN